MTFSTYAYVSNHWHIGVRTGSDFLFEEKTETMQDCVRLCLQHNIDNDYEDYGGDGACEFGSWKKSEQTCKLTDRQSRKNNNNNADYVGFKLYT